MKFSTATDLWSYGIVLLEIVTGGERPYQELSTNEQVMTQVMAGYRAPKPAVGCSAEFYETLLQCWAEIPSNRPSFEDLGTLFSQKMIEIGANARVAGSTAGTPGGRNVQNEYDLAGDGAGGGEYNMAGDGAAVYEDEEYSLNADAKEVGGEYSVRGDKPALAAAAAESAPNEYAQTVFGTPAAAAVAAPHLPSPPPPVVAAKKPKMAPPVEAALAPATDSNDASELLSAYTI